MTKIHHATIRRHFIVGACLPLAQLSYSHMQPIGWKQSTVPSRAPTRDTRPPKIGIPLAIMYAVRVTPHVQLSHVIQWMAELEVRWVEPRRIRTKTYLLGIYGFISWNISSNIVGSSYMSQENGSDQQAGKRNSIGHLLHNRTGRAKRRRRDIRSTIVVDDDSDNNISATDDWLTDDQGFRIVSRITHLGCDREKGWGARIGKNEGRDCGSGIHKTGVVDKLVVRLPYTLLRRCTGSILDSYSDHHCEDCILC